MRTSLLAISVCLLALSTGCKSSPVVGFWQSDSRLGNGERNKLEVIDDFTGEAEIYATPAGDPNTWIRFEFEVSWEDLGQEFEFDLNCTDGPCVGKGDDFDMVCEALLIESDGEELDKLDCEGDKKWAGYPLQWERD
jgi:hypothetical protein